MPFQVHALDPASFAHLFALSDEQLKARHAVRQTVHQNPGTPCRVSLEDARIGETVILTHYEHLRANSPYRASHAVFVRKGAVQAHPQPGEVPPALRSRLLSVRCFDNQHMMISALVVDGKDLATTLDGALEDEAVAYIHLHNAKPGCYAASVTRA